MVYIFIFLIIREFEDHKIYLRDHLISELEEKQKMIETERHNMELTGDSFELKPISTRKLRRRANEPSGNNRSSDSNYSAGSPQYPPREWFQSKLSVYLLMYIINEN